MNNTVFKKFKKRVLSSVVFAVATLCSFVYGGGGVVCVGLTVKAETAQTAGAAAASVDEITEIADGIIRWKKQDVGSEADEYLINDDFLSLAGTTPGDWYPIGLGRLGVTDNFDGYLAVINDVIDKRYQSAEKLDKAKATEWHRISLAMLASGGNPRKAGMNGDIDLIADGTFNRADKNGGLLGKQGINGYIWGLIALDAMSYAVPENAFYTRDDIILNILSREIDGGGWALSGNDPDPDITAMAIQSLAPYFNSEKQYSYPKGEKVFVTKVRDAVNRALKKLSDLQQSDGGFISWGTPNSESAVQVLVALCSLGKNPFSCGDFIKNGKTVFDGIIKYRNADGGFLHSFVYDEDNPSSLPDESNTMASEQALYGMASVVRFLSGKRRLYDFRAEQSEQTKNAIKTVIDEIEKLTYSTENGHIKYNNYRYEKVTDKDTAYDKKVEATVRNYKESLLSSLPVLATSAITITDRYAISDYVSKVAISALGTDYFASNYGGLRSTGDITAGNPIKEDAFYKIIPFDNSMYVVRMQGDGIYKFCTEQSSYNYYGYRKGVKQPEELEGDMNYYTIAIIDYVYLGEYFQPYMEYVDEENTANTQLYLRDMLVEDARLCGKANKRWNYNNTPFITKLDF